MRIVKVGVLAPTNKGIPLGVQGENRATEVEFDTRPWFREYPYGTVSAVARRDGDQAPYPLTIDVADGTAVWLVSDTDTAKAGEGAVELTMTSAGTRVRSLTFKTLVTASLTDAPVDDDAWYGWLDKAVVKVDETVQAAQRKMAEVDAEWTCIKADVTEKVEELGEVAAQAASDAHHAKVDAQATAKALESAEGSVAKAEAAANRAVDAMLDADDSAVEASRSALSAGDSADAARLSADAAAKSADNAATSASNAADAASAASGSASAAEHSATDASNAKVAAQTAKAEAATSASNAATSASNAESSATAAAKSASDAAASVGAINVISPKIVKTAASSVPTSIAIGDGITANFVNSVNVGGISKGSYSTVVGIGAEAQEGANASVAIGYQSIAYGINQFAVGGPERQREIVGVNDPTNKTSAANKKYTDDNDAKTLSEAKNYTDANTSNALVGNVSGKLLHVEDAWPSKPMSLTIDGAYKQDGTPSPDNPVPIEVIENPVLHVLGRNLIGYNGLSGDYFVQPGERLNTGNATRPLTESSAGIFTVDNAAAWDSPNMFVTDTLPKGSYDVSFTMWSSSGAGAYTVYVVTQDYVVTKIVVGAQAHGNWTQQNKLAVRRTVSVEDGNRVCVFVNTNGKNGEIVDKLVVERPTVAVSGSSTDYRPYTHASIQITLPAEHPYLASLPDGTHDEIVIDKYGNATLVAKVQKVDVSDLPAPSASDVLDNGLTRYQYWSVIDPPARSDSVAVAPAFKSVVDFAFPQQGMYVSNVSIIVGAGAEPTEALKAGGYLYTTLATPVTYKLGKLDIPELPETISNVWTDAELTTDMSMTYKRDINVAFENLTQAVVAAAAGE